MRSFADWLREHGLERYEAVFRDNDIDFSVVRQLTVEELKELGLSLGHRKKFLTAIAELDAPAAASETQDPTTTADAMPAGAERRQLTVMFCDLVGSVALSERLDPEELRALIHDYRVACAAVIARYDGHVARYVGDGILTYFGWPLAHEDDAERSIRAALEIVQAVKSVPAPQALAVHIGIATGPVVVGDDSGATFEAQLAVGTTPNLAARLQALAGTDQIVIAASTRRLIGNAFELTDLGEQMLKGIAAPVRVWAVKGIAVTEGRFEATHSAAELTPLIGRDEELGLLLARWRLASEGEGQLLLLCGEAGIGKSRLTYRLREQLHDSGQRTLRYQCSPYHVNSPLYPIVDHFERAAGLLRTDSAEEKLDKLENLLAQGGARVRQATHLFASLLSLPLDRYSAQSLPPQKQKELTLAVMLDFIEVLASQHPVLVLFEDAHWIDSATQELLDLLVPRLQGLRAMLIVTYRPEYVPPWTGLGHVTNHVLNRLSRRQAAEMVVRLGGGKAWPPELLEQIVANTDGIPLFVEELTKAVLESTIVRSDRDRYELTGPLTPLAIPTTLKDSLTARLDRLAPIKEVAQIGACIGREFAYPLLATVSGLPEAQLLDALDQLIQAQLIFRQRRGDQTGYVFKHALIQDAAYQSLLTSSRQRHHQRIADALVKRFPEEVAARPEIVAFHYRRSGLGQEALPYWERAGELAMSRSSYTEAINHFTVALEQLEATPPGAERDRRELDIRVKLGPAYQVIRGMGSEDAGKNYERACDIGSRVGKSAEAFKGVWGHWLYCNLTGRTSNARQRAEQLVTLSKELNDDEFQLQAHHARWTTFQNSGQLKVTRFDIEQGLKLYDRKRHGHHAHSYGGHDPGVCCRAQGGMCIWVSGYPDRADSLVDEGVALARELDHPFSLAVGLWFGGSVKLFRGDSEGCHRFASELLSLSQQRGFKSTEPHAMFQLGWARMASGETQAGLNLMEQGEERLKALGQHGWRHFCLSTIASVKARLGDVQQALALVNQAIELGEKAGIESWRPDFLRQRAEWMFALGHIDQTTAKQQLLAALALAREQTARALELRIAASLARTLDGTSEAKWSTDQLSECLARFDQGADTSDIKAARALLA